MGCSTLLFVFLTGLLSVAVRPHPMPVAPGGVADAADAADFRSMNVLLAKPNSGPESQLAPPQQAPVPYCFPFGCKPGDIIKKTTIAQVNKSLDDLDRGWAARKCMIGFVNLADEKLENPEVYLKSGVMTAMPFYDLKAKRTALLLYHKTELTMGGTEGVMTYDVAGENRKVAVSWSVPHKLKKGFRYNFQTYPRWVKTGKRMFNSLMEDGFPGDGVVRTLRRLGVSLEAVMYGAAKSKVIIRVHSSPPPTPSTTTTPPTTTPSPTTPSTIIPTAPNVTNTPTISPTTSNTTNTPTIVPTTSNTTNTPTIIPTTSNVTNPTIIPTTSNATNIPTIIPTSSNATNTPTVVPTTSSSTNIPTASNPTNTQTIIPSTRSPTNTTPIKCTNLPVLPKVP